MNRDQAIENEVRTAAADAVRYTRSCVEVRIGMTTQQQTELFDQIYLLLCDLRLARAKLRRARWLDDPDTPLPLDLVQGRDIELWHKEFVRIGLEERILAWRN